MNIKNIAAITGPEVMVPTRDGPSGSQDVFKSWASWTIINLTWHFKNAALSAECLKNRDAMPVEINAAQN